MVELSTLLPPRYAGWMTELLEGPVPDESLATCSSCAMASQPGGSPDGREHRFRTDVKCCSYHPTLPNFMVGEILANPAPELARGRASIQGRIAGGLAITPMGVGITGRAAEEYKRKNEGFGQDRSMLCPHFLDEGGGLCAIWQYRNSTCSTYFCKFVRGEVGRAFWRDAIRPLLATLERELAHWALLEVGVGEEALGSLFPAAQAVPVDLCDAAGALDPVAYGRVWGAWRGREAEFFQACAARVSDLRWGDVFRIGSPELQRLAQQARRAYARLLDMELPETIAVGNWWVVKRGPEASLVYGYSPLHLLELPNPLIAIMRQLAGRRTAEVCGWLEREKGIHLEPGMLRRMIDFGVLQPGSAS